MIITVIVVSVIAFVIIQLPPGDYLTSYVAELERTGRQVTEDEVEALKARYGLGQPLYKQYWKWVSGFVRGDMGRSFEWNRPVSELVWERVGLTFVIAISSLIFTWIVAFPIGVYTALKQYSISDYFFTFLSFIGLSIPNFMLALILMYIGFIHLGIDVGGLFSPEYAEAPWSMAKFKDLLVHLWIPTVVVGTAGTAGLVRIMRANLLDELKKPYVETAKSKGLARYRLIIKYPVRLALNPFISTVGWTLPRIISGATITSVVLNLPTTGPIMLEALKNQDMFLAGSFILLISILTVLGTFISDLLLALIDPRIRFN